MYSVKFNIIAKRLPKIEKPTHKSNKVLNSLAKKRALRGSIEEVWFMWGRNQRRQILYDLSVQRNSEQACSGCL